MGGVCCGPGVRPPTPSTQANLHLPSIKYSAIGALLKGESNAQSCVGFGCYLPNLADFVTKPDFRARLTPGRTWPPFILSLGRDVSGSAEPALVLYAPGTEHLPRCSHMVSDIPGQFGSPALLLGVFSQLPGSLSNSLSR